MNHKKKYKETEKTRLIKRIKSAVEAGEPLYLAARAFGITKESYLRWVREGK